MSTTSAVDIWSLIVEHPVLQKTVKEVKAGERT